ncbi:CCAAT/enhancer-binding protein gamma isoform X1 [Falco biarmicus]|uniref:CCAAT/enhancer-binding protein gamma isoform X2 n=1 Tax=Falco cherrug TaxID=345164 RepID=UPI002479FB14|nr:CCAAT/enhancer-binding protein gamma isoform X2 [Falco cherrug]XP_056216478.1 CCAAT/enhancer-binding protein gamma isoform X1 [Falco biarmicus]
MEIHHQVLINSPGTIRRCQSAQKRYTTYSAARGARPVPCQPPPGKRPGGPGTAPLSRGPGASSPRCLRGRTGGTRARPPPGEGLGPTWRCRGAPRPAGGRGPTRLPSGRRGHGRPAALPAKPRGGKGGPSHLRSPRPAAQGKMAPPARPGRGQPCSGVSLRPGGSSATAALSLGKAVTGLGPPGSRGGGRGRRRPARAGHSPTGHAPAPRQGGATAPRTASPSKSAGGPIGRGGCQSGRLLHHRGGRRGGDWRGGGRSGWCRNRRSPARHTLKKEARARPGPSRRRHRHRPRAPPQNRLLEGRMKFIFTTFTGLITEENGRWGTIPD